MNAITDITAAPADELPTEVPARAAAGMALALAGPASDLVPPLPDLLAERNALVDRANAAAAADDDKTADSLSIQLAQVESVIGASTCASIDDAIAKLALVAQHDREGLCFERNRLEVLGVEIGRILGAAAYPAAVLPSPRPGRWVFLSPEDQQEDRSPGAALQVIVAVAKDYAEKYVVPADKAHSAADRASVAGKGTEDAERLDQAVDDAWKIWGDHCKAYRGMIDQILELRAGSPAELLAHVEAYCELMAPHWTANDKAPTVMGRLADTDVEMLAEHMLAGLKRLAPLPAPPAGDDAQLVSDIDTALALLNAAGVAQSAGDTAKAHDLTAQADAPLQRALAVRASTAAGLQARGRLAKRWLPADPVDASDLEWKVMAALVADVMELDASTGPSLHVSALAATWPAWDEAFTKVEAAARAFHEAVKAETAITDAVEIACPPPEALLANAHEQPHRAKRYHLTEASIEALKIPLAQKFEMSRLLTAYDDATDAEEQRLGLQAAVDARDAAFDAWREAHTALVAMPSPTVDALTQKAWAMILDDCFNEEMGEPTLARIGKLLNADGGDYVAVKIYQDLVRLSGGPAEIANYGGFDPAAWLAEFKSKPGVSFDSDLGAPFYDDQLAWDEPQLALHRDFVVKDPDAIRRYHASFAGTPEGDAHLAERRAKDPEFDTRPFIASEPFHFARLFEADDPRLEEWNGRHARLDAQFKARKFGASKPTHAHLWNDLEDWQKVSVRNVARAQKAAS